MPSPPGTGGPRPRRSRRPGFLCAGLSRSPGAGGQHGPRSCTGCSDAGTDRLTAPAPAGGRALWPQGTLAVVRNGPAPAGWPWRGRAGTRRGLRRASAVPGRAAANWCDPVLSPLQRSERCYRQCLRRGAGAARRPRETGHVPTALLSQGQTLHFLLSRSVAWKTCPGPSPGRHRPKLPATVGVDFPLGVWEVRQVMARSRWGPS